MKRLVLIDSHAIIHRAFHALPPLTSPDNKPVNAVYGFVSILLKILKDLKPDYAAAAFDHEGPTFRHLAFERYKAERAKAPDDLYRQIPIVKDLLGSFGIPVIDKQGYEADDIIGTIVREVRRKRRDIEIIIVTGDLDTLQLVDEKTKVFTMRKGVSDTVLYDKSLVRERYQLRPDQLIDFKGLRGDPSDNIPGVRGIGEKTASELLKACGSIEEVYRRVKKGDLRARPAVIAALKTHEADALFSKTLATIDRNVPISFVLASSRLRKSAMKEKIKDSFERLGFYSLLRRMEGGGIPSAPRTPAGETTKAARVKSVASLADVPGSEYAVLYKDPRKRNFFAAADSERVFSAPAAALDEPQGRGWFTPDRPVYVFNLKALMDFPVSADPREVRDLMIMWWLAEPGRRTYDPETLIAKTIGRSGDMSPAEIAASLFACAPIIEKRLKDDELTTLYDELEAPLIPILHRMEKAGIGFDPAPLAGISKIMAKELILLESRIHAAAGAPFNIRSSRQLADALFEKLKLAPKGMRRTEKLGVISTRESELIKLRDFHPVVNDILRFREIAKLKSTYVDSLPELAGDDGRIHTTWNQTGTATGRLSSRNPNLQNIPVRSEFGRAIRSAFVAGRNREFAAFDYSQLELRVAADLSHDEKMIGAFRQGRDIHRLTAAEVNNIPLDAVTPELRSKAKALNFGVLYGMGSRAFAESAGISRDEANVFIEEYFRRFQGVSRFIEETKEFARTHGYTRTAFGRKRFFPDIAATNFRLQRDAERQAVNHPVQGTAADIMRRAMIAADRFIRERGLGEDVQLILQIHDELVFEMNKKIASRIIPEISAIMAGVWTGEAPMAVTIKRGKNLGELE